MALAVGNPTFAVPAWKESEIPRRRRVVPPPSSTSVASAEMVPQTDDPEAWGEHQVFSESMLTSSASAIVSLSKEAYVQMTYPDAEYDESSVAQMLTDRVRPVLEQVLHVLRDQAALSSVSVTRVEVEGFSDPEEDSQQVVVAQWVDLPPEQALDYWEQLSARVGLWSQLLPEHLVRIVSERMAIEVWWETAEDGV